MGEVRDFAQRFLYLRSIPVGAKLSPALLRRLAVALEERVWPAGALLMREKQPVTDLCLLTHGRVSLERAGAALGTLAPPQTLGFLDILAQSEGSFTATCDGETRGYQLDADALLDLMEDDFELYEAALRYVAERMYFDLQELPGAALGSPPDPHPVIDARPMDLVERILLVRAQSGFREANVNAVVVACRHFEEVRLAPGTSLWSAGDPPGNVFMLARGTIACQTSRGTRFTYGPGTTVGGVDALANLPRWYTAIAETPVQALRGETSVFFDLLEHDYSLASDFLASLARGLIQLLERKAKLGQQAVGQVRAVSGLGAAPVGA